LIAETFAALTLSFAAASRYARALSDDCAALTEPPCDESPSSVARSCVQTSSPAEHSAGGEHATSTVAAKATSGA
jgi:hypothetical protein